MKERRQIYHRILALCAAALVVALDAAFVRMDDRAFSPTENRSLQQRPTFTWASARSGRFERHAEDYVADQFPWRDQWIGVKAASDRLMGRVESGGVFLGDDGYLIRDFAPPTEENYAATLAALRAFSSKHADLNQYFLLAPSAVTVLGEKMPPLAPAGDEGGYIDRMKADLSASPVRFVDVRDALTAIKAEKQVYYRTDHHWTTDGAFAAWRVLAQAAALDGADAEYDRLLLTDQFSGTLTASSGFRTTETDELWVYMPREETPYIVDYGNEGGKSPSVYVSARLDERDKYQVFLGGNHPLVRIETGAPSERRALVIKDSYANCLIPFMIPAFRQVTVVDPRYYTDDLETLMAADEVTDIIFIYNAETLAADTALRADID